ncbi:MAG: hypothetical protein ACRCSL_16695 [Microbacterium sp.]
MMRAFDWLAYRFPRLTVALAIVAFVAAFMLPLIGLQWAVFRFLESRCDGAWHEGIVAGRWSGWCDGGDR